MVSVSEPSGRRPGATGEKTRAYSRPTARVPTPTTLVAVRQDQLVPLVQMRDLARRISGVCRLVEIDSVFGHDAFLKEDDTLGPVFVEALEGDLL